MDKSRRYKKSIVRVQRSKIFLTIFFLPSILFLFTPLGILFLTGFTGLDVSGDQLAPRSAGLTGEIASFHIIAKDLNILDFEPLFKEHLPKIKCDGKISLEVDLKFEKGVILAKGSFSSNELSLSQGNPSLPLNLSHLRGDFEAKLTGGNPEIKGKIRSSEVRWGRLFLQNIEADYSLFEKKLDIAKCEVKLAGGTIWLNGNIGFTNNPPVFVAELTGEGINVGTISEKWGNARPISGILFADGELSGEFGKPTTYSGNAKVRIEEGDLGKIGLIGRLITFSPLTTLSRDISLNNMEGDFDISEGYASTDNTTLKGSGLRITAEGDVGWNKRLNFILGFYTSSELLKGTTLTKTLGTIVDNFGNVLRRVKLTGTIDNPQFAVVPLGIGSVIVDKLEKSFKKGSPKENR